MIRVDGPFDKYELTAQELSAAQILGGLQEAYLRTLRAAFMETRARLVFNPDRIHEYTQQEAELMGQILFIDQLIADSDNAKAALVTSAAETQQYQDPLL